MTVQTFGPTEQVILALIPPFSGLLSLFGSLCIIYIVLADRYYGGLAAAASGDVDVGAGSSSSSRRYKIHSTYHRLMLGMSVMDIMSSIVMASSSLLIPVGTPGVWGTHGTVGTCELVGFMTQMGMGTTIYTACLALYFLSQIRLTQHSELVRHQRRARSQCKTISPWYEIAMHVVPIVFAVVTSIVGLVLDLYNPVVLGVGCWVQAYPAGCAEPDSHVPCTRGANAPTLIWFFGGLVIIFVLIIVVSCMMTIYVTVRRQVLAIQDKYKDNSFGSSKQSSSLRLQQTSTQAILYITAFLMTYLWTCTMRLVENSGDSKPFFFISVLSQIFYPLQGFLNFAIYIRPCWRDLRRKHPTERSWQVFRRLLDISSYHKPRVNYYSRPSRPADTDSSVTYSLRSSKLFTRTGDLLKRQLSGLFVTSHHNKFEQDDPFDFDYIAPERHAESGQFLDEEGDDRMNEEGSKFEEEEEKEVRPLRTATTTNSETQQQEQQQGVRVVHNNHDIFVAPRNDDYAMPLVLPPATSEFFHAASKAYMDVSRTCSSEEDSCDDHDSDTNNNEDAERQRHRLDLQEDEDASVEDDIHSFQNEITSNSDPLT